MLLLSALLIMGSQISSAQSITYKEDAKTYALPALFQNNNNEIILSWTEKDAAGMVNYYFARSADKGKTFSDKKLIYAAPGIGTGRLARPRLLFKKNGDMVATFSFNPDAQLQANAGEVKAARPKELQVYVTESADGGNTWSTPKSVHNDATPGVIRGFYDATLMANDELAVVFLKDIPNKPHERDLRLVIAQNGVFGDERIIDSFVCDCCNLGLLTDEKGNLNVYYRENADNIRDIAKMISTDNGITFSTPEMVYKDNWKINACPHTGPVALRYGNTNLISYYSGVEGNPGVRLVTQAGKQLLLLKDETIKTASLAGNEKKAVILYGQGTQDAGTKIGYRTIAKSKVSADKWLDNSATGTNPNGIIVDNELVVVYELTEKGKVVGIKTDVVKLN
ncbi:exo-alpha-sialidase [Taibaiella sp. KBW10]|nr:exo-alpha-sialidase [Taibaiella sp. KBW10]